MTNRIRNILTRDTSEADDRPWIERNEYVELVNEQDDGWGLAAWHGSSTLKIMEYDSTKESYNELHILEDDVDSLIETLEAWKEQNGEADD